MNLNFKRVRPHRLFLGFFLFLAAIPSSFAAVWQWSVPVPSLEGRRAYLWVSPGCTHVRGLIVACQNMLEQPLFERPAFRAAAAANGLGLVLIFSGHDKGMDDDKDTNHPTRSYLDIFLNPHYPNGGEDPQSAGQALQKALGDLADESGYSEIRYAPLMPVGHSSAGSFVWHLYRWDASRIFAMMPFKTGAKDDGPAGIPIFDVNSEWFEYGDWDMHNVGLAAPDGGVGVSTSRTHDKDSLYGYYVDIGNGHCDVSDDCMGIVGLFIKKAVAARIPENAPMDAPVPLKPITVESGALLDPATFGKPDGKAYTYDSYPGDQKQAFWYLDDELADAVQSHLAAQLAKKPEQIGFIGNGRGPTDARMAIITPDFLPDGATFRVHADFVDHIDHANYGREHPDYYSTGDVPLGHGTAPILYRVNSGGLIQVGPDTFRACPRAGPIGPQGNPWEPTLVAYSEGDDRYRPVEHPAHININIVNKDGAAQTLDFPKILDQRSSSLPIKLTATASSGLPVQFFMVSGPASIQDGTLTFDKIPVRAKFPVRVLVSAFQWGRSTGDKIQSAGPTTQEFFIQK